jgi:GTP cyclohydrolase IA
VSTAPFDTELPSKRTQLHAVPDDELGVDVLAAERAVSALLKALGRDGAAEHLHGTPRRVARAFEELLTPRPFAFTTFPNDENYGGLVATYGIAFSSICAHHLLPFSGVAHVGYLPGERLVGLSKLARTVEQFSRDLQVQERLTVQIADFLDSSLQPRGVAVVLSAEHLCMTLRGIQARGATTSTSCFLGELQSGGPLRNEFLAGVPGGGATALR